MGKRERSVVLTPATTEPRAASRSDRDRSRSHKRGHRRVRRVRRSSHKHRGTSKRRVAAAAEGEQRSRKDRQKRSRRESKHARHRPRIAASVSEEAYSSDEGSYYSESEEGNPRPRRPSHSIEGQRPFPFAQPEAATMPGPSLPAEAEENRLAVSQATQSAAGSRLTEAESRGQESPYRQATSDEVPLWVSQRTLACLLTRASEPGVVDKTWGCGLCIRAIDRRSRQTETGKRRAPFGWTTSFDALMQHHSARHADLKAVNQTLLKLAAV
eukprot:65268-Amphidinium_carterae.1